MVLKVGTGAVENGSLSISSSESHAGLVDSLMAWRQRQDPDSDREGDLDRSGRPEGRVGVVRRAMRGRIMIRLLNTAVDVDELRS